MAMVNPKMTSVSGITSRMIIVPSDSGFSRRAPTTAAPIRAWAKPVARAANPIARPAPARSTHFHHASSFSGLPALMRSFETVGRRDRRR